LAVGHAASVPPSARWQRAPRLNRAGASMTMIHYNLDVLVAYATGKLAEQTAHEVEAHLSGCETCGEALDRLTVHTALLDRLHRLGPAPSSTEATPPQLLDRLKQARRPPETDTDDLLQRGRLGQY